MSRRQAFKYAGLIAAFAIVRWVQTPKPPSQLTPEQERAARFHQLVDQKKSQLQPGQKAKPWSKEDLQAYQKLHDDIDGEIRANRAKMADDAARLTPPKGR